MILARFGALPPYTSLTPQDEDCGVGGAFCWGKNFFTWGQGLGSEGLGPGSRVINFANRYARAMKMSKQAEALPVGNAVRTYAKSLDRNLMEAINASYELFPWDLPFCLPGPGRGRCRTEAREKALVESLPAIDDALKKYDLLERRLAPLLDQIPPETSSSSSSSMVVAEDKPLWPKLLMFGVPAAVLLIGGAVVLSSKPKPKPAAVAGYRRRRRRR